MTVTSRPLTSVEKRKLGGMGLNRWLARVVDEGGHAAQACGLNRRGAELAAYQHLRDKAKVRSRTKVRVT